MTIETLPFICALLAGVTGAFQGLFYKMGSAKGNRPDAFISAFLAFSLIVPAVRLPGSESSWGDWRLWVLGCGMGFLVYISLQSLMASYKRGPASICWVFMALAFILTIFLAALFPPWESLQWSDALTLFIFGLMIWFMNRSMKHDAHGESRSIPWMFWLLMAILLIANGGLLYGFKIKDAFYQNQNTSALMLIYIGVAFVLSLATHIVKSRRTAIRAPLWTWREIWTGLLAGLCAGAWGIAALGAMALPATIGLPVMQVISLAGGIVLMAVFYKERFNRDKILSIFLAIVVLLVATWFRA